MNELTKEARVLIDLVRESDRPRLGSKASSWEGVVERIIAARGGCPSGHEPSD